MEYVGMTYLVKHIYVYWDRWYTTNNRSSIRALAFPITHTLRPSFVGLMWNLANGQKDLMALEIDLSLIAFHDIWQNNKKQHSFHTSQGFSVLRVIVTIHVGTSSYLFVRPSVRLFVTICCELYGYVANWLNSCIVASVQNVFKRVSYRLCLGSYNI